jgi:hypothetical protein
LKVVLGPPTGEQLREAVLFYEARREKPAPRRKDTKPVLPEASFRPESGSKLPHSKSDSEAAREAAFEAVRVAVRVSALATASAAL